MSSAPARGKVPGSNTWQGTGTWHEQAKHAIPYTQYNLPVIELLVEIVLPIGIWPFVGLKTLLNRYHQGT